MAVSASLNVQWRTNSRRSVGGSNSAAIWASVSCCRRISRVSPEVKTGRPADPGQGVDERAAPDAKDAANRGLHGAPVNAELDTYPWRISEARRQRVLSLSAYATKIGRSLVPASWAMTPTPRPVALLVGIRASM